MLGPSTPYLIWWTLHKNLGRGQLHAVVLLTVLVKTFSYQSLFADSPGYYFEYLTSVTQPGYSSLNFCCSCLIAAISAICTTLQSLVVKTSLHSLTRCLYMSDTEGDWEWAQWSHCYRLVPTGGTTGTQASHTDGNSEELPSWYWTM